MADGRINIDTRINSTGFNQGVAKMAVGIRGISDALGKMVKNVLVAGLLVFGITAMKLFASLRDTMQEVINMRGGKTKEEFQKIKDSLTELRTALAVAFLPLIEFAIPYIQAAISWLIKFLNTVAMITGAFLGQTEVMQVVEGSAAGLREDMEGTEKAAKGVLASFDQINVLQQPQEAVGIDSGVAPQVATEILPITSDILAKVTAIKEGWEELKLKWTEAMIGWGLLWDWLILKWNDFMNSPFMTKMGELWAWYKNMVETLWTGLIVWLITSWWSVRDNFVLAISQLGDMWEWYKNKVETVWTWLIVTIILGWENLKQVSANALGSIHDGFVSVFSGIGAFVQSVIDYISGVVNRMVANLLQGINDVIDAANRIGDIVPGMPSIPNVYGTLRGTVSASVGIPRLATGAIIPPNAAFAAILGDQKSGTNIEAPADLIRQIVREEMSGQNIHISFEGSLGALVRELKPHIDKENTRVGGSLIKSGVA